MPPRFYLGTITGTSVDGLDLALIDLADGISFSAATTAPFDQALRTTLLAVGQPGSDDLDQIGRLDAQLGEFIGIAVNEFLDAQKIPAGDITAIGSHGQTIRHRPDAAHPFSWQIGDPNRIAEITGITTVADFRRRDMAAGGQGAPLVPRFHEALFRDSRESRTVVNIGGISNVTLLDRNDGIPVSGFDTGPGNALLDDWCQAHTGRSFDEDGQWAASGLLIDDLLQAMLKDPYLSLPPPKSTGREYFNSTWLHAYPGTGMAQPADVQRTLLEYTAASIVNAIASETSSCERLIVCGGGRRNAYLMSRLTELADLPVESSEVHGFDGDAIEAAAFAWLAARRLADEPGNVDTVTGATGPRVLGAIYPGEWTADP